MAILPIVEVPDPRLRQISTPVETVDDGVRKLIADMFETMYDAHGIGLAAPQIGRSERLIVLDVKEDDAAPMALLDPTIVEFGDGKDRVEEGCLSIPGVAATVERPMSCVVEATDARGQAVRIEAQGMLARCLQHEIDHLDGVLFFDRISPIKRKMLLAKYRKLAEK